MAESAEAATISATVALTDLSKKSVGFCFRSVVIQLSNHSSNILINPQGYTYSGFSCYPPRPTLRPGAADVCAFQQMLGSPFGTSGVVTYDITEDQGMKPVKRLAIMFSVPFNYVQFVNRFALGLFEIDDRACDKYLYEHMYYQQGKLTRGKASGSEIRYQNGKYILKGTMSSARKAYMKLELLDENSFHEPQ